MPTVLYVLQLALGLLFYSLIGMGILAAFLGQRRFENNIYMAMNKAVWGPKLLAGALLPTLSSTLAQRVLAAVVALVAWFSMIPTAAPVLAYWGLLRTEYLAASWLLLLMFLLGTALTVPSVWLRSFSRGLLAMALLAFANRALVTLFRAMDWLPAMPT